MRVLITGAMAWTDAAAIRAELSRLKPDTVIVHGDSPGADALAGRLATEEFGLRVEAHAKTSEDYRRYRRAAWKGLNERMLAGGVDLVLVFHGELDRPDRGRGTRHLIGLAEAAGVEIRVRTG